MFENNSLLYTVLQKSKLPNSWPYLCQILTDFQNSFTVRLSDKFAVAQQLKIISHLKRVATLLCEILMSENKRQFETHIAINDKSQRIVAMQLGYCGIFIF